MLALDSEPIALQRRDRFLVGTRPQAKELRKRGRCIRERQRALIDEFLGGPSSLMRLSRSLQRFMLDVNPRPNSESAS